MNGINRAVLDSNILIYLSKEMLDASDLFARYDEIFISVISYIESLGYNFPNTDEQNLMNGLLQIFPIVQTDMEIAVAVVDYRKRKKIKTPDAIILATAKKLNADLVTVNEADFKNLDAAVAVFVPLVNLP